MLCRGTIFVLSGLLADSSKQPCPYALTLKLLFGAASRRLLPLRGAGEYSRYLCGSGMAKCAIGLLCEPVQAPGQDPGSPLRHGTGNLNTISIYQINPMTHRAFIEAADLSSYHQDESQPRLEVRHIVFYTISTQGSKRVRQLARTRSTLKFNLSCTFVGRV
jgi:hypothetical protein